MRVALRMNTSNVEVCAPFCESVKPLRSVSNGEIVVMHG